MDDIRTAWNGELSSLISAIGEKGLAPRLLALLHRNFGADHAAAFHLHSGQLDRLVAASIDGTGTAERQARRYIGDQLWRSDPTIEAAESQLSRGRFVLLHTDIWSLDDTRLRDRIYLEAGIEDRVLLCGRTEDGIFGLSVLRGGHSGPFSDQELSVMQDAGELLLAVLARHARLTRDTPDVSRALTTLTEIEACVSAAPEAFPRREAEVCSRIIYGISTLGIALELDISQETVMTYRKRAYHRIGIATQRELLLWYLHRWNVWAHSSRRAESDAGAPAQPSLSP